MILVTGANGFLGQYVCDRLLTEGHAVKAMVRDVHKMDSFPRKNELSLAEADLLDPLPLADALENVTKVIHCAALVSFDPADCSRLMQVNVEGTRNLVNACLAAEISYFIHVSSVAALGRMSMEGTVDESAQWQESKWNTCYGESKYQSELEVWRSITEGLPGVVLNPSIIIGRPIPGALSNQLFDYVREGRAFYPTGNINYVDVRNVCDAISFLLQNPVNNERYILNAESIPYQVFFAEAAKRMNKKAPYLPANNFAVRLALWRDWWLKLLTGKKRSITRETLKLSRTKIFFNNEKARRELTSTFASLSESLDWIINNPEKEG